MSSPRSPRAEEFKKVVEFLNLNLRQNEKWSIEEEYPLALNPANLHNIRIIEEDGKIVSHAVLKILLIKTPIAFFKVAAIGSVVTLPEYRNKGYSSAVIKDCLDLALKQDADFAILWTDIFDFYRKLGFELAGSEIALIFNSPLQLENSKLNFLNTKKIDPQAILRLYNQHSIGSLRSVSDIKQYLSIPNSRLFTAWDQKNQLQAYAVEGRGADLSNYIHEWGGEVSSLLSLIGEIQKYQQGAITIITPGTAQNLIRKSKEYGALINNGYLGMIKIINYRNLFFKVKRFARYLGQEDFILDYNGTEFLVGHSGHIFRTQQASDIVKLIFGPHKANDINSFDVETAQILNQTLPVPMWIWGWDSV
jgi:GNAT superfamily N-acetyltransferase